MQISLQFPPPSNGLLVTLLLSGITGTRCIVRYLLSSPHVFNVVIANFRPTPALASLRYMEHNIIDINWAHFNLVYSRSML